MAITRLQPFNLDTTKSYTFGNVTAVGNVNATYFIGNGSQLTGVTTIANSISSGTSNIFIVSSGGNIAVGVGGTGNVVVWATTGQYVTGLLSVSGNITGGNILTDGLLSVNGNITGSNLLINNDATITGNLVVNGNTTFINSNVITTNDKSITLANNQSTAANVDGAGIDIGNTTIAYWRFNNATTSWQSNVGLTPAANATLNLGGATNYWGNAYIDAVNANTFSAVGNVTGGNLTTAGLTSTTNFNITGNVTGNLLPSANGIYSLGSPDQLWSNLYLTGNTITLGTQTLSSNTVTVITSNNFQAANIDALYNITTIALSASGNVTSGNVNTAGTVTATGNVIGGNLLTGGLFSAGGNIIGGNLLTGGLISATSTITSAANITGGNVLTGGQISAAANITGGNLLTSGYLSVAGNATITGDLSVTGNIIGVLQDHGSDSNNWDAITRMGTYTVNRASWAGTIGTPLDSQVFVGLLEVLNSSEVAISQVFYPGTIETGNVNIQWNRSNWANVWSPWIKIINNDQIVSGGEF